MKYLYILLAISGVASLNADWNDGYCDEACRQRYYEQQRAQGYNNQGYNNPSNNQQRWQQSNYGGYAQSGSQQDFQDSRYTEQLPNDQRMMRNDQRVINRNSPNQYGGYDQNQNNPNPTRMADDRQLNDRVKGIIAGGWFSKGNQNVSFDVNNGVVTLRGSVDSQDEKNRIEQDVRKIDGIRDVNNQITVAKANDSQAQDRNTAKGDYSQDRWNTDQDRQLNSKIRAKLSGWFSTKFDGVILQTNNGTVVLWGTVKNVDDQNKLTAEVKNIDGVRNVTNNTKVQNEQ